MNFQKKMMEHQQKKKVETMKLASTEIANSFLKMIDLACWENLQTTEVITNEVGNKIYD